MTVVVLGEEGLWVIVAVAVVVVVLWGLGWLLKEGGDEMQGQFYLVDENTWLWSYWERKAKWAKAAVVAVLWWWW